MDPKTGAVEGKLIVIYVCREGGERYWLQPKKTKRSPNSPKALLERIGKHGQEGDSFLD